MSQPPAVQTDKVDFFNPAGFLPPKYKNVSANQLALHSADYINAFFDDFEQSFYEKGGKPLLWKRPVYMLVMPVVSSIGVLLFLYHLRPSVWLAVVAALAVSLFSYVRFEQYRGTQIAIYPHKFVHRYSTFKLSFKPFIWGWECKEREFRYCTGDLCEVISVGYGLEHLGLLKVFYLFSPRRWFATGDIIVKSKPDPLSDPQQENSYLYFRLPMVRSAPIFHNFLSKVVSNFMKMLKVENGHREYTVINGSRIEQGTEHAGADGEIPKQAS